MKSTGRSEEVGVVVKKLSLKLAAASAVAGLLVLAGCKVDQKKEVAQYRTLLDASSPGRPDYDGRRPLTLAEALATANADNERLGISGEDYVQSLINKNRALAGFLPTVSFQPSYTLQQTARVGSANTTSAVSNPVGGGGTGTGNGTGSGVVTPVAASTSIPTFRPLTHEVSQSFQAPVVGGINLFRGGYDIANLKAAEATILQRRELLFDTQEAVLINVAQAYYAVLRAEQSADVLRQTLKLQEARLADVTTQFQNGLAIQLTVSQTRAQVDQTRVDLVQADGDVRNGRSTLALLMGVPRVDGPLRDDFQPPQLIESEQELEAVALDHRRDLAAARDATEAARKIVDRSVAEYYPSVSLNVQGFLYREFYSDASKWNAILSMNLPIFSAGLIEADVRQAWSQLRQAKLSESYTQRQVLSDVQTAYENLQTADRRVQELNDEVAAADEAFRQAQSAFRNSLAVYLDVLTAQDQLLSAQLQLTSAQFDRTVYYLDLLRQTGRMTVNEVIHRQATTTQPAAIPASQPSVPTE